MFRKIAVAAVVAIVSQADDAQAIQIKSNQRVAVEQKTENKAQWGFLKNIVNIDRFFDSGVKAWGLTRWLGRQYPFADKVNKEE